MARRRPNTLTPLLVRHEVPIAGLDPRHDGVKIAHLSDLHVGRVTGAAQIEEAVALANFARADLIVMTGDFVTYARHEVALLNAQIGGLRRPTSSACSATTTITATHRRSPACSRGTAMRCCATAIARCTCAARHCTWWASTTRSRASTI